MPVFVFGDHFNRQTSKGNLSVYPGIPTNSITAHGYAYVCVNFNDVCLNTYDTPEFNGSFTTGVHRVYGGLGRPDSWGTISAWAWCFSRTVDWIESRPELDGSRIAIVGHSRGGKTALWAAAQDKRIAMVVSNNSGPTSTSTGAIGATNASRSGRPEVPLTQASVCIRLILWLIMVYNVVAFIGEQS